MSGYGYMNLSEIIVMCMHFDIATLGRFALDVLIALDVESVYYITYNIWVYMQIFIKAINILSILLFKRLHLFQPDFFFVPKYPYSLYLSRAKIEGLFSKNTFLTSILNSFSILTIVENFEAWRGVLLKTRGMHFQQI